MLRPSIRSLFLCIAAAAMAAASPILPVSYTATPAEGQAQGGTFNYFDDTGAQLIDGTLGVDNWQANLGNGNAYEWVGWRVAEPSLEFNFAGSVNITEVKIGFQHTENAGIFLPASVTIGGDSFAIGPNEVANGSRGFLTFSGNWSGPTLGISITDANTGGWIFVDEVEFEGEEAGAVPEPATGFLILSAGLVALLARFRRK